jgi:hypothetical protein
MPGNIAKDAVKEALRDHIQTRGTAWRNSEDEDAEDEESDGPYPHLGKLCRDKIEHYFCAKEFPYVPVSSPDLRGSLSLRSDDWTQRGLLLTGSAGLLSDALSRWSTSALLSPSPLPRDTG